MEKFSDLAEFAQKLMSNLAEDLECVKKSIYLLNYDRLIEKNITNDKIDFEYIRNRALMLADTYIENIKKSFQKKDKKEEIIVEEVEISEVIVEKVEVDEPEFSIKDKIKEYLENYKDEKISLKIFKEVSNHPDFTKFLFNVKLHLPKDFDDLAKKLKIDQEIQDKLKESIKYVKEKRKLQRYEEYSEEEIVQKIKEAKKLKLDKTETRWVNRLENEFPYNSYLTPKKVKKEVINEVKTEISEVEEPKKDNLIVSPASNVNKSIYSHKLIIDPKTEKSCSSSKVMDIQIRAYKAARLNKKKNLVKTAGRAFNKAFKLPNFDYFLEELERQGVELFPQHRDSLIYVEPKQRGRKKIDKEAAKAVKVEQAIASLKENPNKPTVKGISETPFAKQQHKILDGITCKYCGCNVEEIGSIGINKRIKCVGCYESYLLKV